MMYPYAEFLLAFDRSHRDLVHRNAPENTRAAVIIESRPDYFLPVVIRETMHFLGPRWNLHVFCGELNHAYVCRSLEGWDVHIQKLPGLGRLTVAQYSGILMSPAFWSAFAEDKVLVFQTDSILCGSNVDDFFSYDFVGAPCGRFDELYIANGGLSLRSRRVMLDCLSRLSPKDGVPEDVFFTAAARSIGAAMPGLAVACRFAVESIYTDHPFGVHGTDKNYHSLDVAEKITRAIRF
jgi:hypothetical protein